MSSYAGEDSLALVFWFFFNYLIYFLENVFDSSLLKTIQDIF